MEIKTYSRRLKTTGILDGCVMARSLTGRRTAAGTFEEIERLEGAQERASHDDNRQ